MIALDTNVIVRFLVRDDEAQALKAKRLIESKPTVVPVSVLLECEWVLRSGYDLSVTEIMNGLDGFVRLPGVSVTHPVAVRNAIAAARSGVDFADALHVHLGADGGALEFATFDKALRRRSEGLSIAFRAP